MVTSGGEREQHRARSHDRNGSVIIDDQKTVEHGTKLFLNTFLIYLFLRLSLKNININNKYYITIHLPLAGGTLYCVT